MKILAAIVLFFLWQSSFAQEIPVARSAGRAFVKGSRDKRGVPGRLYWQNRGDYDIRVSFDPATRALSGSVGIDYFNNSPDTLNSLVFKLYPNFYKDDAMRNMPVATGDLGPGVRIGDLTVDGQRYDSSKRLIRGTNMYLKGCRLSPGQRTHVDINYQYTLNKGSFVRTGQVDSGAFFIAYFFPRLAVYDDIDGWNEYPYVGKEEFYNDYGNFHAAITVPGAYQVWATGDLKNGKDVYTPKFLERIGRAERSDTVTDIITREDLAGLE